MKVKGRFFRCLVPTHISGETIMLKTKKISGWTEKEGQVWVLESTEIVVAAVPDSSRLPLRKLVRIRKEGDDFALIAEEGTQSTTSMFSSIEEAKTAGERWFMQ